MAILRSAGLYFAQVFAAGFALGAVRVPLLVPRLGERTAELLELPLMLLVIVWSSRRRVSRTASFSPRQQLVVGAVAWLLLACAELSLGALFGRTPQQVVCDRDPISGSAYAVALVVFALLPWWWARLRRSRGTLPPCPGSPPSPGSPAAAPRERAPATP
ncbi:MAG: hypothetical protein H6838_20140 [Planctomycetes bacterium]|nr:hypothetical protein [Planctomycetota bacterium]MCB9887806.1 hypothetical protein [Planctomycetota bacterium]